MPIVCVPHVEVTAHAQIMIGGVASKMSTDGSFIVRGATEDDLKALTRFLVMESWPVNPHDLACGYAFDPSGFFVGELNGEIISHISAVKYPGHSAYIGNFLVKKEHRGKSYGRQIWDAAWKTLDHNCTGPWMESITWFPRMNLSAFSLCGRPQ